ALVFIDEYNRLRISLGNEDAFRSSSTVGTGLIKLGVERQGEGGGRTYTYSPEPMPLSVDLDGDGIEESVVPQNQFPGRLAVVYKGPGGYRFQGVNSGFEGTIVALGAVTGDVTPSLVVAVARNTNFLNTQGETAIIMTTAEGPRHASARPPAAGRAPREDPPISNRGCQESLGLVRPARGMPVKFDTAPPRGMKDLFPAEVELRDRATATILATYRRYGFRRIETPALENLRLLQGSGGGENEKLIYKVLKRGAKLDAATTTREEDLADLGLRFDLTVPLARYYAHHRAELPDPFKAIQIGPVWRAERPQKGRFRQFTQCDIDILGVGSEVAEVELILATAEALIELGLEHPRIRLNDRRILSAMASFCGVEPARHGDFFITLDKRDKIGREGVERELREAGHDVGAISKLFALVLSGDGESSSALERLAQAGPAASGGVETLRTILRTVGQEAGNRFTAGFDASLVRGMGYYTGPIFEAAYGDYGGSIAGGGRYDRMVGRLLGQDVPACGFSI